MFKMGNENRNLKLYWRWLKRISGILGAVLLFCKICEGLDYMYVQDDTWSRILLHHFYADNGKIDNVYLGSSHVYCDINPMQLDAINEEYNFNLSSSAQMLNGSYYLLREANQSNALSHVYLELYYICSTKDNFNSDLDPIEVYAERNFWNTDYMKNSYNKFEYMLSIAGTEKYMDTFLPFSRYRVNLDNWDYIKKNWEAKEADDYCSYQYHCSYEDGNGYEEYKEQGYFYSTRSLLDNQKLYWQERILGNAPMGEKSEQYFHRIINYCKKNNIPVTLFISPIYELQLISTEGYDNYINQVREIAQEYDIEFYDFNLVKEEYLPIQKGEYFRDVGHLNSKGADMFTPFFYKVVSGNAAENEKYFYNSYEEKLHSQPASIYGLYYRDNSYWVASNREMRMEYRIILTPVEGEQYMIQDFAENKMFEIPAGEHGICTIVAREENEPDKVQTLEINY